MRDHGWLRQQLEFLLKKYFSDIKITNPIDIRFGREAKYRFGSIKLLKPRGIRSLRILRSLKDRVPAKSIITITSMFARENIPVSVVQYTIAHELSHYAHGFSSYNKRMFRHPHHGGVVNKELARRGASEQISAFKKWLKVYRKEVLHSRTAV